MNDVAKEFAVLMRRVQRGDQEAAWELLAGYSSHLRRYVRRTLNRELRTRFDSIDFVQVVWASFFREPEKVRHLATPTELMNYLATLARNKVVDDGRRLRIQRCDVRRDIRIEDLPDDDREALSSRDPTPSAVAMFRERWQRLFDAQPPMVQRILELRFEGATYSEIAEELRIHERTARRMIARLVDEDPELCDSAPADAAQGG